MLNHSRHKNRSRSLPLFLLAIMIGAWIFEYAGYPPCELCLMQRWAYYAAFPLPHFWHLLKPSWIKPGLIVLGLILAANAIFGVYHSGIEWKWWARTFNLFRQWRPCHGTGQLLEGLKKPGVMCNEAAIRILGIVSGRLECHHMWRHWLCWRFAPREKPDYGSSSVSQ